MYFLLMAITEFFVKCVICHTKVGEIDDFHKIPILMCICYSG